MIHPDSFTKEWIERVSSSLDFNDKNLIEKVIRALSLLEMLQEAECPFIFKGGTALMRALANSTHRLSIDIDITCPPGTDIEEYLSRTHGFTDFELVERRQRGADIPKSHSKLYYQIAYRTSPLESSYILLDVLYEERYLKYGKSTAMEIIKQLYDVGRLYERVTDLEVIRSTLMKIASIELSYRSLRGDPASVLEDIRQTALCISTRGAAGVGDFRALQEVIVRVKSYMYQGRYTIEDAIVDASRVAYLATLVEKGAMTIERYSGDPLSVVPMTILPGLSSKLNKLKKTSPEAFYNWSRVGEVLLRS